MSKTRYIIILLMLNISSVYAGSWSSTHHDVSISFNDKVWSIAEELDSEEDTLIGFYDKQDGSTFLIRIEFEKDAIQIPDEVVDEVLLETLRNSDREVAVDRNYFMSISGNDFRVIDYEFNNSKYGLQRVRHAYAKLSNHIFMLMMSWPIDMNIQEGKSFPIKHLSFIEGLSLRF